MFPAARQNPIAPRESQMQDKKARFNPFLLFINFYQAINPKYEDYRRKYPAKNRAGNPVFRERRSAREYTDYDDKPE